MSTSIDERVSGLPTDLEEGNSLNEDKPSIATGLDSKRQDVESSVGVYDAHMNTCLRCGKFGGGFCREGKKLYAQQSAAEMVTRWYVASVSQMPRQVTLQQTRDYYWLPHTAQVVSSNHVFSTEKEAINAARNLRVNEIDRLQNEVNTLDERYDLIEDEEMKKGNHAQET